MVEELLPVLVSGLSISVSPISDIAERLHTNSALRDFIAIAEMWVRMQADHDLWKARLKVASPNIDPHI